MTITGIGGSVVGIDVRPADGMLYAVISDGSVVTVDKIHLTARYSRELGSALREALEPLLGAPDPLPGAPG